jgi:hypothetical protein
LEKQKGGRKPIEIEKKWAEKEKMSKKNKERDRKQKINTID